MTESQTTLAFTLVQHGDAGVYIDSSGRMFRHNDVVRCTSFTTSAKLSTGRLVQVRKGVGGGGTDLYLLRLACGTLGVFGSVGLRPSTAKIPRDPADTPDCTYKIFGQPPAKGFIVELLNQDGVSK